MKVAIFFDGQNFYRSLLRHDESLRVDYDRLATWITEQVGGASARFSGYFRRQAAVFRYHALWAGKANARGRHAGKASVSASLAFRAL